MRPTTGWTEPLSGRPAMRDHWDEGKPRRRRSRGRRKLTPEERAYREARERANARIGFYTHAIAFGSVSVLVLFTAGFRPAFIMALAWGIGLTFHYFGAIQAPAIRRRMIEREVDREVAHTVPRERRNIEGRHARSIEALSASIAHEIRNPITAAKSLVQQMGEDPASGENVDYAKVALDELDRVERSISHLLRFAREEEIELRDVRMVDVLESALATFDDRVERLGVRIEREVDAAGTMRGDPEKLRRILLNLLGNALDALEQSGTQDPAIRVLAGENLAGTQLWVRVKDNGPGMAPETLERIFSPFYTSKQSGTGLGLAISKKLVDAHGGSIEATSTPGEGTEFVLTFPREPGNREG
ncbi:MAG: HAMP domain-containing sensor histidine kinase [Myxococcota bacterium]|nr:HAMP domain-containing sensor histidine kinase [Myxococcota bacterium]